MSTGEAEELAIRYEQLRREYSQRVGSKGMAIFLDQGMCAWMRAWADLAPAGDTGDGCWMESPKGKVREVPEAAGEGYRDEMVKVVAAMALTTVKECTGCGTKPIRR